MSKPKKWNKIGLPSHSFLTTFQTWIISPIMPFVLRQTVLIGYLDSHLANSPELFYTSIVLTYWNPMVKQREIWFRRMWGVVLGSNTGGKSVMVIHAMHFRRVPVVHPPLGIQLSEQLRVFSTMNLDGTHFTELAWTAQTNTSD